MWDRFELKHLYRIVKNNNSEMSFGHGSSIKITTSARSSTVNRLHISEYGKICRHYPERALEIKTGGFPAVSPTGRIDIESTAEGDYGYFYDLCQDAIMRKDKKLTPFDFKFFFFPWWQNKKYELEHIEEQIPTEMRIYQARYGLSEPKLNWYVVNRNIFKDKMKQEYPSSPDEAFEASVDRLIDTGIINKRLETDVELGRENGKWIYYRDYYPRHEYGIGCDVAEGVGGDSSTIVIIDFSAGEVVAEYESNNIAPDLFAYIIRDGAQMYGSPIVCVERNNHGHAVLSKLREIYPESHIYRELNLGRIDIRETHKYGWLTGKSNKPIILYDLRDAIEDNHLKICSRHILSECKQATKEFARIIQPDGLTTKHWDRFMALCLAWEMRKHRPHKKKSNNSYLTENFDPSSVI